MSSHFYNFAAQNISNKIYVIKVSLLSYGKL